MNNKYIMLLGLATAMGAGILLGIIGCQTGSAILPHKLVVTAGEHSVPMYPDEPTFLKVAGRAQEGGASGAVGDVEKQFTAKSIDDQTAVDIISSDSNGDEVRITDGPMKGQVGFVAPQNVS